MTKTIFLSLKKKKKKKKGKGNSGLDCAKANTLYSSTDNNRTNNNTLHTEQQSRQQREQITAGRAYLLASHIVQ